MGISILLILLTGLLFPGLVAIVKAKIVGRKGPGILQPIYDILKLLRKGNVYSATCGFLFQLAPVIYFSSVFVALLFLPVGNYKAILSFEGDFVLFAYMLALGRFLMIIAAMDTGSGFEGMGANREAFYSLLAEPAFFTIFGSLALLTGHTSFYDIFTNLYIESVLSYFVAILMIYILFWVSMVENSRLPVDDPKTHLELTMVHEVMVLDHSGFDLALIQLAGHLKFAIFGTLIFNLVLPIQNNFFVQLALFPIVQIIYAVLVGLIESFRARNKMMKNAQWIITLSALSVIVFISILIITGKINI
ncbi:MAG TPA: NADH-quinone oxidoreductase subunit H [Bacteroidales bacterium]|jgi:formate hydrogenlyase subunit 4|nr:NADH-quinone oxidoreductase subunit H [Bacteroidales bacterium]